jgi:hypothetical protein
MFTKTVALGLTYECHIYMPQNFELNIENRFK